MRHPEVPRSHQRDEGSRVEQHNPEMMPARSTRLPVGFPSPVIPSEDAKRSSDIKVDLTQPNHPL